MGEPIPDGEGWVYGVRHMDGSVSSVWSGRTQRQRAEERIAEDLVRYAPDAFTLVRRRPGGAWEPVGD